MMDIEMIALDALVENLLQDLRAGERERRRPAPVKNIRRMIEGLRIGLAAEAAISKLRKEFGVTEPDPLAGLIFYER